MPRERQYTDVNERMAAYRERKRQAEAEAERQGLARIVKREERAKKVRMAAVDALVLYLQEHGTCWTKEEREYFYQIRDKVRQGYIRIYVDQS